MASGRSAAAGIGAPRVVAMVEDAVSAKAAVAAAWKRVESAHRVRVRASVAETAGVSRAAVDVAGTSALPPRAPALHRRCHAKTQRREPRRAKAEGGAGAVAVVAAPIGSRPRVRKGARAET